MKEHAQVGLFVFAITASGLALADCPNTMPSQLLQDCITYEGAGSTFPTSDYAHMNLYNDWLRKQQPTAKKRQAEISMWAAEQRPYQVTEEEIEGKLARLDKISYHPSLLPILFKNRDYLELTPEQVKLFRDWRKDNFKPMFSKMKEIVQGRAEFIEASLNPDTTREALLERQKWLFKLQEEVLAYKLSCRENITGTFTSEQWENLYFLLNELQVSTIK